MAIVKITAPLATAPNVFAAPVIAHLQSFLLNKELSAKIGDGVIYKGAMFNIGGSMFIADSDTTITGTSSDYVKLTVSGDSSTPSYVTSLTGVTWDDSFNGYYDTSGNCYIFDEMAALSDGEITEYRKEYIEKENALDGTKNGIDSKSIQGVDPAIGSAGTYGFLVLSEGQGWIIPAGLYMFAGNYIYTYLQIYDGSSWHGTSTINGLVLSDGVNYRVSNEDTNSNTIYYRKLL